MSGYPRTHAPCSGRTERYARRMGLLTFSLDLTVDGCVDHVERIADDETHAPFTRLTDAS